jgi:hypothetical protein
MLTAISEEEERAPPFSLSQRDRLLDYFSDLKRLKVYLEKTNYQGRPMTRTNGIVQFNLEDAI